MCTTPPMLGKASSSLRWVGVSEEGARSPSTFTPVEIDDDHVVRPKPLVGDAARLDREHALRTIDGTGVAEGQIDQAVLRQGQVGLVGFPFQLFVHVEAI